MLAQNSDVKEFYLGLNEVGSRKSYREVKRYCQALGHPVQRLRRIGFGPLRLGSLPVGGWRELTARELAALNDLRGDRDSPILHRIR